MGLLSKKKDTQIRADMTKPFGDIMREQRDSKKDIAELAKYIGHHRAKKVARIYHSNRPMKVIVVYNNKKDIETAEDLRKNLGYRLYDSYMRDYQEYRIGGSRGANTVVFIGDPENLLSEPMAEDVYTDKFNCKIVKYNNHFALCYEPYSGDFDKLLEYYYSITKKYKHNAEKISKLLDDKEYNKDPSNYSLYAKELDRDNQLLDEGKTVQALLRFGAALSLLPFGVLEGVFASAKSVVKGTKLDKEIAEGIQKSILMIKGMELIEKEREKYVDGK